MGEVLRPRCKCLLCLFIITPYSQPPNLSIVTSLNAIWRQGILFILSPMNGRLHEYPVIMILRILNAKDHFRCFSRSYEPCLICPVKYQYSSTVSCVVLVDINIHCYSSKHICSSSLLFLEHCSISWSVIVIIHRPVKWNSETTALHHPHTRANLHEEKKTIDTQCSTA